jgi:transketolase C-terminal domain/subunit
VTVEDHSEVGGLASIVAETAGRRRLGAALRAVALPDSDLEVGMPAALYEYYGLTVAGVVAAALELMRSDEVADFASDTQAKSAVNAKSS